MADYEKRYEGQLTRAANTLVRHQRVDGGWGLRPTSVSSIVNTAESMVVLKAAGLDGPFIERGARFLIDGLPLLFKDEPRTVGGPGGRGRHLRFLTFFLDAILNFPDYALSADGRERLHDCVKWFASFPDHRGGIPETVDSNLVSLHQTARVANTMSRLVALLRANADQDTPLLNRATAVLDSTVDALLNAQLRSGAWPVRAGERNGSAAKTSLAVAALAQSTEVLERSATKLAVQRGHEWLIANYDSWRSTTSRDRLEKSTDWVHLDYAECVRGALVSADIDEKSALRKSWKFLTDLWSDEEGLWYEPATDEGNVTIRAAYHTVVAFESARPGSALQLPRRQHFGEGGARERRLRSLGVDSGRLSIGIGGRVLSAPVASQIASTAAAIQLGAGVASSESIAKAIGVKPDSVPVYVKRLNEAIGRATSGQYSQAVRSRRLTGGSAEYYFDTLESG